MTEQYVKVSVICASILPYSGTYQEIRVKALGTGEITLERFTQDMRIADDKFAQAIADLKAIRFSRMAQRAALAKLISGFQSFRHGIAASIKGAAGSDAKAWQTAEQFYTRATKSSAEYFDHAYKDRMKGVGV